MAVSKDWSKCLELYKDMRTDEPGVIRQLRNISSIDFSKFIRSCKLMDEYRLKQEIEAVREVLKMSEHPKKVLLYNCGLGKVHLEMLLDVFADVKLAELDISRNSFLSAEGWVNLGRLVKQSGLKKLDAYRCRIRAENFEQLSEGMNGAMLTELDIRENNGISPEGWLNLGRLIKQSKLKQLDAGWCEIKDQCVEKLSEGMGDAKLTELHIGGNKDISPDGWLNLGRLVRRSGLKKLGIRACDLKDRCVEKLFKGMYDARLTELSVIYNHDISPEGWLNLGRLAKNSRLKILYASNCDMNDECVVKLLKGMEGAKLTELYIYDNQSISSEGWLNIGRLVKQSGLKKLDAGYCGINDSCVEKLLEGMDGAKLTELSISSNFNMSPDGWLNLGRLIKQSGLKKLEANSCSTKARRVMKLIKGMDGAKLDYLHMSEGGHGSFYTPALLKLLPLLNEELNLEWWRINEEQRAKLQEKMDQEKQTKLTVELRNIFLKGDAWLKASPMDVPATLPQVENVRMEQDCNRMLATWDPLLHYSNMSQSDNLSYYVVVEREGKKVGVPVTTTETTYTVSPIQPWALYRVFIWAFTGGYISKCASSNKCKTGVVPVIEVENPKSSVGAVNTRMNLRRRSNRVFYGDAGGGKSHTHKKTKR